MKENIVNYWKRVDLERIMVKCITTACFVAIGFGIGVFVTLKVVGFTW